MPNNYDIDRNNDPARAEAVQSLSDNEIDIEARDSDGGTALMSAANEGKVAAVQSLLDAGADVEARDKEGRTALMWAAYKGKVDAMQLLLDAGADIEARRNNGLTALDLAQDPLDDVSAEDKARTIAVLKSHTPHTK